MHACNVANNIPLGTGSNRERTAAVLISANGSEGVFGVLGSGQTCMGWAAGGPIDAPEVLPAGGVSNTEWRNGAGQALVRQMEVRRA